LLGGSPQRVVYMPPALVLVLRVPHGAYFTCHYEGVRRKALPLSAWTGVFHRLPPAL
jgi:hypothetical protein